jgi:hypothetical protein
MTRTIGSRWTLAIGAVLCAGFAGTGAQAQGEAQPAQPAAAAEEIDRTPEDCVLLSRVNSNTGINDHQIVFVMRGGTYFRSDLPAACPSLKAGEKSLVFHYRTGSSNLQRLCNTDTFTVERQTSRIGCGLGVFHPITAEEASALLGRPVGAAASSRSSSSNSRNSNSSGNQRRERN